MSSAKVYQVLLVEPSPLVGAGLLAILSKLREMHIIDHIADLSEFVERRHAMADVLIIAPSALSHAELRNVRRYLPLQAPKLVALLSSPMEEAHAAQFDATIGLYDTHEQVAQKMRFVLKGTPQEAIDSNELTERELAVLACVAKGLTNKEISNMLNISINTVTTHRKRISHKLGIYSISGITAYAIMNKIVNITDL